MKSKLLDWPAAQKAEWTARQAYIALGNLLSAAADFRIDACPIEGFEAARVNQLLDLDARGLSASVITALGYRAEEDATQYQQKVRRPEDDFFIHI
jgi:nitroreductase